MIVVVDDELPIRESLLYALKRDGLEGVGAQNLGEAEALLPQATLYVLDLMLPDGNGLDFLRRLRASCDVPVVIVTSRDDEVDKVVGLELGADDYVSKPFSPREVVARVRAVLRRMTLSRSLSPPDGSIHEPMRKYAEGAGDLIEPATQPLPGADAIAVAPRSEAQTRAQTHPLSVHPDSRRAHWRGQLLPLSKTEFDLLAVLLSAPGRVFERAHLLDKVWTDAVVADRTVDAHLKSLRRKIAEAGGDPEVIETVRGVGYRLRDVSV
ncbi:MAG: response regulator transcription factor [Deltaproteobacteria bacterium]|nr:response regulator transcription factor [Deltaproteobacteria bacterium]